MKKEIACFVRFSLPQIDIVDRAAEISGDTRTEFVRLASLHKAREVLDGQDAGQIAS